MAEIRVKDNESRLLVSASTSNLDLYCNRNKGRWVNSRLPFPFWYGYFFIWGFILCRQVAIIVPEYLKKGE